MDLDSFVMVEMKANVHFLKTAFKLKQIIVVSNFDIKSLPRFSLLFITDVFPVPFTLYSSQLPDLFVNSSEIHYFSGADYDVSTQTLATVPRF